MMRTGVELISEERIRQVEHHGYDNDDFRTDESLAMAGACYAMPEKSREMVDFFGDNLPKDWSFKSKYWKPTPHDRIRELQKAGALIAAEIDRLQKLNKRPLD